MGEGKTGVERLRELAREWEEHSWSSVGKVRARMLADIADQIEREMQASDEAGEMKCGADGTVGPMSRHAMAIALLDDWEREAIAWVRDHGGVEFLDLHWGNMHRLVAEVARRLGYRPDCEDCEPDELLDALDERLMPEGMEWPRFEDDAPVRIGDEALDRDGNVQQVGHIDFFEATYALCRIYGDTFLQPLHGQRVRRPALDDYTDSLERFEADCDAISEAEADEGALYAALGDYCARRGLSGDDHISLVARDLARRARALEGRA